MFHPYILEQYNVFKIFDFNQDWVLFFSNISSFTSFIVLGILFSHRFNKLIITILRFNFYGCYRTSRYGGTIRNPILLNKLGNFTWGICYRRLRKRGNNSYGNIILLHDMCPRQVHLLKVKEKNIWNKILKLHKWMRLKLLFEKDKANIVMKS